MPEYRKKRSARIELLETDKGIGSFGLKDSPAGRRQFVERLARRAQSEKRKECGLAEIEGQGLQSTLKALIASIIRTETAVPVAWITEKLKMGTTANVTRASKSIVERLPGDRRLEHVRKQIYATIPS